MSTMAPESAPAFACAGGSFTVVDREGTPIDDIDTIVTDLLAAVEEEITSEHQTLKNGTGGVLDSGKTDDALTITLTFREYSAAIAAFLNGHTVTVDSDTGVTNISKDPTDRGGLVRIRAISGKPSSGRGLELVYPVCSAVSPIPMGLTAEEFRGEFTVTMQVIGKVETRIHPVALDLDDLRD